MGAAGKPKTGGRKKGSKNIKSLMFADILAELPNGKGEKGFNPVEELVECYHRVANTDAVMHLAIDCLKAMLPYVYSKPSPEPEATFQDLQIIQRVKHFLEMPKPVVMAIANKNEDRTS